MRAAVIVDGRLEIEERPDPVPGDGEILIRVRAAGVNGADLMQRAGRYPPPPGAPPDIPGLECAGRDASDGERVMALLPAAATRSSSLVHEPHVLPRAGRRRLAAGGRLRRGVRDRARRALHAGAS